VQSQVRLNRVPKEVPEKAWEVRFNRIVEEVPEVWEALVQR